MSTFSVVIPWCDRPELGRTLAANAALFERHAAEVLIVNCGGNPAVLSEIVRKQPISRLRHLFLRDAAFNRPLAKNLGALCSTGTYVLLLDADVILVSDLFRQASLKLAREHCFVHVRTVDESQPTPDPFLSFIKEIFYTRHLVLQDGRVVRLKGRRGRDGSICGPGIMAMRREHFIEIGGFNSALVAWGFEDYDVHIRLQAVVGLSLKLTGRVLHLTHGDDKRASPGADLTAGAVRNELICTENYSRGLFRGTYDEDVHLWRDELREMPG